MINFPPEIRNHIYTILFQPPFRVVLGDKALVEDIDRRPQSSQLLETCHQIHDEAILFIYQNVTVEMTDGCGMLELKQMAASQCMCGVQRLFLSGPCERALDLRWLRQLSGLQFCELWIDIDDDGPVDYTHGQVTAYHLLLDALKTSNNITIPTTMRLNLYFQFLQDFSDGSTMPIERVRPS